MLKRRISFLLRLWKRDPALNPERSKRFLEVAGDPERDLFARLDLDGSPVAGLRPVLAARFLSWRIPSPLSLTFAPFFMCFATAAIMSLSKASTWSFGNSWDCAS
jgi:hypothetical protein